MKYILSIFLLCTVYNMPAQARRIPATKVTENITANTINYTFPYSFQTWDINNGLTSNFCNRVAVDKHGYVYAATNSGIFLFNGRNFSDIPYSNNKNASDIGMVYDLLIDSSNRLWYASKDYGLGLIDLEDPAKPVQHFLPPPEILPDKEAKFSTSNLCLDRTGNIWVGTRGAGLFRFDTSARKFHPVRLNNPYSLFSRYIRHLSLYNNDTLFVGIINGLSIINLKTDKVSHLRMTKENNGKEIIPTVRDIVHWNKDTFAIATDRGTYWLHLHSGKVMKMVADNSKFDFSAVNSNDIYKFPDKELWVATEYDGVVFYRQPKGMTGHSYNLNISNKGVSKNFVSSFFEDNNNNLWIAHNDGLSLFRLNDTRFNSYTGNEKNNPFAGVLVSGGEDALCFKTDLITRINAAGNQISTHQISTSKESSQTPSCVMHVKGDEFVLFYWDQFYLVNTSTYKTKQLPLDKSLLNKDMFRHFRVAQCFRDTMGSKEVWVMRVGDSRGTVLLCYEPGSGKISYLPGGKYTDTTHRFDYTKLIKQGNGKYWVATSDSGLLSLNLHHPEQNRIYAYQNTTYPTLPGNKIADMTKTGDNALWLLVYNKGLCYFNFTNPDSTVYTLYDKQNGLTDLHLHHIGRDNNSNLWIVTNNGLYTFETRSKQFYNFSAYNGFNALSSQIPDANDIICTDDSYMFLSDRYGNFVWFATPKKFDVMAEVSLVFRSFAIDDSIVSYTAKTGLHYFSPYQNNITFRYDVLDYGRIAQYKIMYMLDGYDKDWQVANNLNSQTYRQLPGKNYVFRMKLQYANGVTSPEISIPFRVGTIWYRTWWFNLICILMLALVGYLVHRGNVKRKLARQRAAFEKQYAVELERSRISTELHDDLGSGLSTIRILSEMNSREENTSDTNYKISSHAKELLQSMNEIVWALNTKNDTLESLISYIREQSAKTMDETGITCSFNIPAFIPEVKTEGMNRRHIQLLVKEALHNIVKHAAARHVSFTISIDTSLYIGIWDNGKGIPHHDLHTLSGNGIRNMYAHAKAVKGTLMIENSNGTTIKFSVPLENL